MKITNTFCILILALTISCQSNTKKDPKKHKIEVQGHRGERGNMPENTIEAFLSALHKGVDVIELDVIVSKDKKVVVSHEPYMSALYMNKPSGDSVLNTEEKKFNLYQMDYNSIKKFDSGSRGNKNFPNQQKIKTYKPLLSNVFYVVENEIIKNHLPPIKYNIEIKSHHSVYGTFQPQPEELVNLVMQVIIDHDMESKINIQSFDPTILNILNNKYPAIEIAFLISEGSIKNNLNLLKFKPEIYSPNFKFIKNKATVDSLKKLNIKLIPWTVNNKDDIKRMIKLKVDGIITDYPERVLKLLN